VLAAGESVPEPVVSTAGAAPVGVSGNRDPTVAAATGVPRRALASPKARRIAAERGVDLAALSGSGPGGAVVAADLDGSRTVAQSTVSGVWRLMAERTTKSWQSVPHFYLRREVDASRLESWRSAARAKPGTRG